MNNANQTLKESNLINKETLTENKILVQKRNGNIAEFDGDRIKIAIEKAFKAQRKIKENEELDPFSVREVKKISEKAIKTILNKIPETKKVDIEKIQDLVEILLMQSAHYSVAKGYILYREERAKDRLLNAENK
jgi:ribonucleoside-diphosphate reductase alpha chain